MTQPFADADAAPELIDTSAMTEIVETTGPATGGAAELASAVAPRRARRSPLVGLRRTGGGIGAVSVKELRGRMRGRRAFVILTIYLLVLAVFAWMVELILERSYATTTTFVGAAPTTSAAIGQGIFAALLMLETLLVAFLAPLSTAGAISLEREKQTLDMLVTTPISSFAIVVGKLFSALIYVWLLIAASIPLTAVVFVFGGVSPDDVVRGYLVLLVTALGFGSFGLLCSSVMKRTQSATSLAIVGILAISLASVFTIYFWNALATGGDGRGLGPIKGAAPAPLVFLNPFLVQMDVAPDQVLCSTDQTFRYWCRLKQELIPNPNGIIFTGSEVGAPGVGDDDTVGGRGFQPDGKVIADVAPSGVDSDPFWQKTVIAWLILSAVFLVLSVQFVSPTRRWHIRRGRRNPGSAIA